MTREELDITDRAMVNTVLRMGKYDVAVNAAAYTAVDKAESEPSRAHAVNRDGPAYLASACADNGAALIHVSTDYVFDGEKETPYSEADPVAPVSVYGRSKADGEDAIRAILNDHLILRTAWVYSANGHNFVKTILKLANERDELRIVADQTGCPTSAADLAQTIITIVERIATLDSSESDGLWGTYNCVNCEEATWFEFAAAIVDLGGDRLSRSPLILPISAVEYPTPARRPANSRLDCEKLSNKFNVRMRPWRQALAPVVNEILSCRDAPVMKD